MGKEEQFARAAGKMARQWMPTVRNSGKLAKHVLPAAFKPVHSLWHQILALIFLAFAGSGSWWMYRHAHADEPGKFVMVLILVIVTAGYGISSWRKSRLIDRA